MKIEVLTSDGSPLGVTERSLRGEDGRLGVGGSELALLTMCAGWKKAGHEVILYNNPREGGASSFEQRAIDQFHPENDRDALIIFRSPNSAANSSKGKKIFWSCDPYTMGDYKEFAKSVDKIVTISPYHSQYFKTMYGINDTVSIDLPVRTWEYNKEIEKVRNRCIFTSMPDRGLMSLHAAWPLILKEVPDASLVITSDWRLWAEWQTEDATRPYRLSFAQHPNVIYLGAIKRQQLVEEQLRAELFIYPSIFSEMFCIACSEAQVAGAYPITSNCGALATTNMGMVIAGNPTDPKWIEIFVSKIVEMLKDEDLKDRQEHIRELAIKRFSLDRILEEWDTKVFKNG